MEARTRGTFLVVAAAAAVATATLPSAAANAAVPTYHSPGYAGHKPIGALVATTLPPVALGTGKYPNLFVDPSGTAHIVYSTDGGTTTRDSVQYCALQRGATSCGADNPVPTPMEPEGDPSYPGNFPAGNHDFDGPVPLDIGNTLYIADRRFPDTFPTPAGTSESNVFLWSQDPVSGNITSGLIGDNEMGGGAVAYGGTANPSIGTISRTETGGTFFQGVPAGQYTTNKAQLGTGDQAYDGSVAADGELPIAAFADLSGNIFVREWSGQGNVNDASAWSETSFHGYSPQIVGGPAGVFVLYRDDALSESNVFIRRIVGGQPSGAPVELTSAAGNGGSVEQPTISEDGSGRIAYGFVGQYGIEVRTSTDGVNFSSPEVVATIPSGGSVGHLAVAATADGGGFATYVKDGAGAEDIGSVMASAFGTQQATGRPGLGTLPGGGVGSQIGDRLATSTCNTATFGPVHVKLEAGCWFHDPSQPTLDVSLGPVDINGLEIIPDANAKILIDPRLHSIDTVGSVSVQLKSGSFTFTLWHGGLDVKLPLEIPDGTILFDFSPPTPPDLGGFPVEGKIDVKLTDGGVAIPISLSLQPADFFGGITGEATLLASLDGGLQVSTLQFTVGDVSVGAFELQNVDISYTMQGDTWTGTGTINVPTGGGTFHMKVDITFQNGGFAKGSVEVGLPYPGIPLDDNDAPAQQLWFDRFTLSFGLSPQPSIGGGVSLGFTPLKPPGDPTGGNRDFVFSLDGGAEVSFGDPVTLTVTATGYLQSIQIETGKLVYTLPGSVTVTGSSGYDLGVIKEQGTFGAILDPTHGTYGIRISGDTTVDLGPPIGSVDVSSGAFAANNSGIGVYFPFGSPPNGVPIPNGVSVTYAWGDGGGPQITFGKDVTSQFTQGVPTGAADRNLAQGVPAGAADRNSAQGVPTGAAERHSAHAAAVSAYHVPAGTPELDVRATGVGGAPSVVLTSPSGRVITPAAAGTAGAGAYEIPNAAANVTYVGVRSPAAGQWSVQQAPGSAASLSGVTFAVAESTPTVRATISGSAFKRTVHYRASLPPGATVTFAEETPALLHVIGHATGRAGTFRFTPLGGHPGRRQLVALIDSHGLPYSQPVLATFVVPRPPMPGRPRHLRITAGARAFKITFAPPVHAVRTLVSLIASDGRHMEQLLPPRAHKLTVQVIGYQDAIAVTVAGINADGRRGPAASAHAKVGLVRRPKHHRKRRHR